MNFKIAPETDASEGKIKEGENGENVPTIQSRTDVAMKRHPRLTNMRKSEARKGSWLEKPKKGRHSKECGGQIQVRKGGKRGGF